MKILHSATQHTYNIIHDNGMQTSIKLSPSGFFTSEQLDRDNPILCDKNKYTVIISSSHGCQMSCSFCHLTQLGKEFKAVSKDTIVTNVIEAIEAVNELDPSISTRYIKLCYMGEGEAILNMNNTCDSAYEIIYKVLKQGLAVGLDGVDIATSMPNIPSRLMGSIITMNAALTVHGFNLNPYNHSDVNRSIVRLFYSMHHYNQNYRDIIIPNSKSIEKTLELLEDVSAQGVNVVVHYMFITGVNDDSDSVESLISFVNSNKVFEGFEFRVLRYNGFSEDKESPHMSEIIQMLESDLRVGKLKVQFSAGEDVSAACGMFI
jgi:adenine C2-methylase RlmN of 23S rRNA A2503 and tRNA A37